ncbi:hypothetical protein NDK47_23975 [Brevibacillus ruminantium]|uniref:AP2 domain-containing protein n=1 Tax=Brevibacillus ruminantium TaxID=2950604 RepID=A0ABY4WEI7_9BACL|nr:hypothetical protein [Brevibacillus ruminantium]USG65144.1 hypothetical protein NDK47_23975 [Brevibacillus ruminantium]
MKHELIPGQRFNRLEVIREVDKKNNRRQVLCKCDCGNEKVVNLYKLLDGLTRSCGCLNREAIARSRFKDLTNHKFGRLRVIGTDGNMRHNRSVMWECECECGEIVPVSSRDLTSGNKKSCGCLIPDHTSTLKEHNEKHHTVDGVFVPLLKQKLQKNSTTGAKGVSIQRKKDGSIKYVANITIKGKRHYLGIFDEKEDAIAARAAAEEKYHKPYLEGSNDGNSKN